jgi:sulfate/thiosulfate transport system permease protein
MKGKGVLWKNRSVLPGFGLAMGWTIFYLCLLVMIPLSMIFVKSAELSWHQFWQAVAAPRAVASYRLTLELSLLAATINAVFGLLTAWVLVRYRFPGRRIIDGIIDLPFALPTAVAGIVLTTLYAENGWIGSRLAEFGIKVAYTPIGIVVALTFVGLPFVVRTLQPVLQNLDADVEEAAASLGASLWQTFRRVVFPEIFPAWATGSTLAFARALGEYGSVIFIAGNMPFKTEVTPLLIMIKLDQFDYAGASAIAVAFLVVAFGLLLLVNAAQRRLTIEAVRR